MQPPIADCAADLLQGVLTAELTKTQRDLLAKLKIAYPKKIIEATPRKPLTSSDTIA